MTTQIKPWDFMVKYTPQREWIEGKGRDFKYAIPFGPFLSLGAVISLFFGEDLIYWYLTLTR